jgi:hypothetical protein
VSEQKHTPEPWEYWNERSGEENTFNIQCVRGDIVAICDDHWDRRGDDTNEANAARIVACVNALDGIPDPAAFVERARAVEAERDELRNAAKEVLIGIGDKPKAMCRLERAVYNPTCLQKDTPHA